MIKRKLLLGLFLGLTLLTLIVPPEAFLQSGESGRQSFLPPSAPFIGSTVLIPMRDGQSLAADLYLPKSGGKFPVVLIQTPYNKDPMRTWWLGEGRWGANSIFTDTNYAFVVSDWRGKFASKNAQVPGKPPNLGQDGFDTIHWIRQQEWSNGKIATWGLSALGRVQYETARENPPDLVCSVPMVMPLNLDYDTYFPGGVLWEEFTRMLGRIGFGTTIRDTLAARPLYNEAYKAAEAGFVKGEDIRLPMLFIGGWFDIYADGVIAAFETVRSQGGEKARRHSRLIMGPWVHNLDQLKNGQLEFPAAQYFGMKKTREFMDYWVRGISNGFDRSQPIGRSTLLPKGSLSLRSAKPTVLLNKKMASIRMPDPDFLRRPRKGVEPITYFQMGANEWRSTETWPPKDSRETKYYLKSNKMLTQLAPKDSPRPLTFIYDPANPVPTVGGQVLTPELQPGPADQREKVESRSDVLVFSTPLLRKNLAIAGKVKIRLFVSSDRPDTDFTAILTDVYPDGRSMLISEGIRRMRLRHSTSREELMKPGEVYPVTIELSSTAQTFLKGHRLRLILSSSNYPKYALNLNDDGPMYRQGTGLAASNSVYVDQRRPSALILPVVKR